MNGPDCRLGVGGVWFNVPDDAGFDLVAGHFVRMIDEAPTDPLPTKETQVNPLTLDEPVVPGGSLMTGTGVEAIGPVFGNVHSGSGESVPAVFVGSDSSVTFFQTARAGNERIGAAGTSRASPTATPPRSGGALRIRRFRWIRSRVRCGRLVRVGLRVRRRR